MAGIRAYYRGAKRTIVVGVTALVAGMIALTLTLPSSATPQVGPYGSTAYPGNLQEISNACGPVFRFDIRADQYGVIPAAVYARYPQGNLAVPTHQMTVPVYGYLDRRGLTRDQIHFYSQDNDPKYANWVVLRAMYDYNTTVVWYTAASTPAEIATLENYAKHHANTLVLPWPTNGRELPYERHFAFAHWGISQTCQTFESGVLTHFIDFTAAQPVAHPTTAPSVKTPTRGVLPGIAARDNPTTYMG